MISPELLCFLLLPIAAMTGWWIGHRGYSRFQPKINKKQYSQEYYMGIHYLLNEQTDKALDVFMRTFDVDNGLVETHLTLGSLFRRQGEVERAIRLHEGLIARPSLNKEQRAMAVLELARDYIHAGVLDRAENLLLDLIKGRHHVVPALEHLIEIYQQEKEWKRAIEMALRFGQETSKTPYPAISHYYCELAEASWAKGSAKEALTYLRKALKINEACARASFLQGQIHSALKEYKQALKALRRVQWQQTDYLPEALPLIAKCYEQLGNPFGMKKYLAQCLGNPVLRAHLLSHSDWFYQLIVTQHSYQELVRHIQEHPSIRGIKHWMQMYGAADPNLMKAFLPDLHRVIQRVIETKPVYRCQSCGFSGRLLQWLCPGCKLWNTFKPIVLEQG